MKERKKKRCRPNLAHSCYFVTSGLKESSVFKPFLVDSKSTTPPSTESWDCCPQNPQGSRWREAKKGMADGHQIEIRKEYTCMFTRWNTILSVHGLGSLPIEAEKGHSENRKDENYLHGHKVSSCFISLNLYDIDLWDWDQISRLQIWCSFHHHPPPPMSSGHWNKIHPAEPQSTGGASLLARWDILKHPGPALTRPISPLLLANLSGKEKGWCVNPCAVKSDMGLSG